MADACDQTISELAAALADGKTTSSELVEAAIANHEKWDGLLHAYSHWAPEAARTAARAADAAFAAGRRLGALQGIPISVKDLFGVTGFPTFAGTPRPLPPKWEQEGPLVTRLKQQLGVIVGKTHMVEFALGGTGANAHWGAPRNPWDRETARSPGGSSSGAGVSLAEGSALVALGSDTAGSVRIPAAATGHVGLKVTRGRWSAEGLVPLSPTFDTPGLLVRSVADAVTCFGAADPAWGDAWGLERHIAACALADMRIGVGEAAFWSDCEAGIAEAVEQALGELAHAGARLKQTALPEVAEANAVFREGGVSAIELRAFLESELPGWLETLDPINAAVVAKAASVPATTYINRLQRLARLAESADAAFEAVDVLACPTLAITPPALAAIRDGESHWQANRALTRNTCPVNYLGLCAITLPVGRDRLGLPVGLQLIARGRGEETLLAIAAAAERTLGTASQRLGPCPLLAG